MNNITLVTSIPPALKRISGDKDVSAEYQLACIDSWIDCGFNVISVNSESEKNNLISDSRIAFHYTETDASDIIKKPLVYIESMIDSLTCEKSNIVAITNADIMVRFNHEERVKIENLSPGEVLIARRIDVSDYHSVHGVNYGVEYKKGVDFICMHKEDLSKIRGSGLVFGAPWWDHYIPLALALQGVKLSQLRSSSILHLKHSERWSKDAWIHFGGIFVENILKRMVKYRGESKFASIYLTSLEKKIRINRFIFIEGLKSLLFIRPTYKYKDIGRLRAISELNLKTLENIFQV
jgi:hypothetical protein